MNYVVWADERRWLSFFNISFSIQSLNSIAFLHIFSFFCQFYSAAFLWEINLRWIVLLSVLYVEFLKHFLNTLIILSTCISLWKSLQCSAGLMSNCSIRVLKLSSILLITLYLSKHTTSFQRCNNVKRTSCACWDVNVLERQNIFKLSSFLVFELYRVF